jgi:hypothetical protein
MSLTQGIAAQMMQLAIDREQEGIQSIIDHDRYHNEKGLIRKNKDGSFSSVVSTIVSDERLNNGRETVIPLLWEGKQVSHKKAVELALKSGKKWPSADTVGEAHMLDEFAHKYFMTGDR